MINVLREVAAQRLENNDGDRVIQLSSVLMRHAVHDVSIVSSNKLCYDPNGCEFKLNMFGEDFIIMNRAYRDDTNDADVEEVIMLRLFQNTGGQSAENPHV